MSNVDVPSASLQKNVIDTTPNPNPSLIRRHFEHVETELAVPISIASSPSSSVSNLSRGTNKKPPPPPPPQHQTQLQQPKVSPESSSADDYIEDNYIYNDSMSLTGPNVVPPASIVSSERRSSGGEKVKAPVLPPRTSAIINNSGETAGETPTVKPNPYRTKRQQSKTNDDGTPGMLPAAVIDTTPNPNPSAIRRFFEKCSPSDVKCHACGELVYPTEQLCLTEDVSYHKACFRCAVCSQHLTIKTFVRNPVDRTDAAVYCRKHVPRIVDAKFDGTAIGIRGPLNAQRVLKKGQVDLSRHHFDARNLLLQRALKAVNIHRQMMAGAGDLDPSLTLEGDVSANGYQFQQGHSSRYMGPDAGQDNWAPRVDIDALHIKTALDAQKNRASSGRKTMSKHHYLPDYVHRKQNEILKAQEELELLQRTEEDALLRQFQEERNFEEVQIQRGIELEFEDMLLQLTQKYEKLLQKKGSNRQAIAAQYEEEKRLLRQQMDEKLITTQRTATIRLRHKEQDETSRMIERHGRQMLELLWNKQREVETEIEQELMVPQMKQGQEITMKRRLSGTEGGADSMVMLDIGDITLMGQNAAAAIAAASRSQSDTSSLSGDYDDATTLTSGVVMAEEQTEMVRILNNIEAASSATPPPPHPPSCRKCDLFIDSSVFSHLDSYVLEIAQTDPESFTKLVYKLMKPCLTDLEKARAIFRWITAKDLNVIDFSAMPAANQNDTPLGILRAIKMGVETYHTLFRRLCSYAGLNCVEVRGHSKSVGYEPGMHIEPGQFLNTWNAVLLDGDWRLVQCNWGARHLVLNKDQNKDHATDASSLPSHSPTKPEDSIRYQQDEHYFLTDPEDFITEFWPFDPKWQLLAEPITLDEFEQLPFVRSVFFHYGMSFVDDLRSVVETDECGGTQVRIGVDSAIAQDIVFHYQLRFADRQMALETVYRGIALERFVFQSINGNQVLYKVFVPAVGDYFLEVFANRLPNNNQNNQNAEVGSVHSFSNASRASIGGGVHLQQQPFRLKCACKFRVRCQKITQKMHPLPACSAGEWGPAKALRHFSLQAVSHPLGAFDCADQVQISFAVPESNHQSSGDEEGGANNQRQSTASTGSSNNSVDLHARLHMNNIEDRLLEKFVTTWRDRGKNGQDQLIVRVAFPQAGQYGLDIYARRYPETNFAHACKYLINVRSVARPDSSIAPVAGASPVAMSDKFGPTQAFNDLGLKAISHRDTSTVILKTAKPVDIEFGFKKALDFAFHFMRAATFEDMRGRCQMLGPREAGKGRVIFRLDIDEPGHFLLAIYARRSDSSSVSATSGGKAALLAMSNVFNYHVICTMAPVRDPGHHHHGNNFAMATMSSSLSDDAGSSSNGSGTPRSDINSPNSPPPIQTPSNKPQAMASRSTVAVAR